MPELVGNKESEVVFGKHNGAPNVELALEKFEIGATEDQKLEILSKIKDKAYKKKSLVNLDDF